MPVFPFTSPRTLAAADPVWHDGFGPPMGLRVPAAGPAVWRLDRNCSMAPRALAWVLGWLGVVSLGIATVFVAHGAWMVLPFALIEVSALGLAFLVYARHATDGERLWLDGARLVIEREVTGRVQQRVLDATWLDVRPGPPGKPALLVKSGRDLVEVGRLATAARRQQVWRELRQALAQRRRATTDVDGST